MRSTRIALLVTTTLVAVLLSGFARAQEETDHSIRAQPLTNALTEFAEQTGMQLVYPSELTAGVDSNGASTEGTPDEILDELLASTDLAYEYVNDRTIAIVASVVIGVDDQGGDSDSGNASLAPILMVQNTDQTPTLVNDSGEDVAGSQEGKSFLPLEEIIVVGTNIRGVENPTVPVLTFDREDIALTGATTVEEFLRTIPQNFSAESQLSLDSANPNTSGRNITQGTVVDLRGLGPGSTLTLLNGRRMAYAGPANFVDVSILPLAALDRVDVLTDGASAIYGSDAVGGVVNFITRKDYEGLEASARYGTVTDGSKSDFGLGAAGGFTWDGGAAIVGLDYQDMKPLSVAERDFVDLSVAQEDSAFGSDDQRFSVAASASQELSERHSGAIDLLYSSRTSEAALVTAFADDFVSKSEQEVLFVNTRLEYEATDDLFLSLFVDYGRNQIDVSDSEDSFVFQTETNNDVLVVEGQASGKLFSLPSGDISFSVGALYREETFETVNLDLTGDRGVSAVYAEALLPIVSPSQGDSVLNRLELSIAGRYEDYSDFGDTFDPKIGVYAEFNEQLSFRASYSESFRAPDLDTLNREERFLILGLGRDFFTSIDAPEADERLPRANEVVVMVPNGGNPNLLPETAETWSAGINYSPSAIEGLEIGINFFDIAYTNRLEGVNTLEPIQTDEFGILVDIPPSASSIQALFDAAAAGSVRITDVAFLSSGPTMPDDVQVFINAGTQNVAERDVSGLDFNISYSKDTDVGGFTAALNATHLLSFDGRISPTAQSVDQLNTLYRPVDMVLRGSIGWSRGGYSVSLALNHRTDYQDRVDDGVANTVDDYTTADATLSFDASRAGITGLLYGARIGLTLINVLDEKPPFVLTTDGLNFDTANADPYGRQVRLSIAKRF